MNAACGTQNFTPSGTTMTLPRIPNKNWSKRYKTMGGKSCNNRTEVPGLSIKKYIIHILLNMCEKGVIILFRSGGS